MTTPIEALRIARGYIVDDIKRKPSEYDPAGDLKKIDEALASLEGDAVERVARYGVHYDVRGEFIHPQGDFVHWSDYQRLAQRYAILATGLVPDEAAIRADERPYCDPTAQGEAFYLAMYMKDGAIWDANQHKDVWINKARDYERRRAAAIRSGDVA